MTIEELRAICKKLKGATEDIKWENHLCFNIGDKMFLITAPDEVPVSASFKTSNEDFDQLSIKKGFKPAPYLAKHKWVFVEDIDLLNVKQWNYYAKQSYELIASKLPAKTKKQLGLFNK
jgi:predicted DNA-binding protein (MmcQ/YjbR family)